MQNGTDCGPEPCGNGVLLHTRYFPRQMITAADMSLEQTYWRDKLRRHNRYLHGWGVVCGAWVEQVPDDTKGWRVQVTAGYILGPYGDEILIETKRIIDLQTTGLSVKAGDPPGEWVDPWCTPVKVNRKTGEDAALYIMVRYREFKVQPVRVQPLGCGCDDADCEMSRLCDGYEIRVCTKEDLPTSHTEPSSDPLNALLKQGKAFDFKCREKCSDCPDEPWVVLAKVVVGEGGNITEIDNNVRRMVLSFAEAWWQCEKTASVSSTLDISDVGSHPMNRGKSSIVEVFGTGFQAAVTATFTPGSGIGIDKIVVEPLQGAKQVAKIHVTVATSAPLVGQTLALQNPGGSPVAWPHLLDVEA